MVGLRMLLAEMGMIFGYVFGEFDTLFDGLVILIIIDYVSGVIKAIIKKKLSSEIGYQGILRKMSFFAVVALANIIDKIVFADAILLRYAVILLFVANEGVSIIENLAEIGVPIPKRLIEILIQVKTVSKTQNASKKDITDAQDEIDGKFPYVGKNEGEQDE